MSMPGFIAERALGPVVRAYGGLGLTGPSGHGTVVPQYSCGYTLCTCCGLEDCYQMNYVSSICWPGSLHCDFDARCQIKCTCIPAIV
jgi:hypothetical protein